jgi:hypothetical protein
MGIYILWSNHLLLFPGMEEAIRLEEMKW